MSSEVAVAVGAVATDVGLWCRQGLGRLCTSLDGWRAPWFCASLSPDRAHRVHAVYAGESGVAGGMRVTAACDSRVVHLTEADHGAA